MRLARYLVCMTAVLAALGMADAKLATAGAPTHSGTFVTCTTPVTVDGAVEISSARAERGTALTPTAPDETCTVTE
jgi:hypothetical protein